jgi:hypothetical protein
MNLVKPDAVTTTGSITRSTIGTYFDSTGTMQTAAINEVRVTYEPVTKEFRGVLIENAATNILLNTLTLSTQSVTVSASEYTLSFYGTGTVTLSGVHSATVIGTGVYPNRRTYAFTPTAGTLTLTVSGTVEKAQLELGATATSWISTAGSPVTRAADVITGGGLVYTTLTESNPEWSSATTYALGADVVYGIYGTYKSLQSGNLNHTPPTTSPFTDDYWTRTGPTNKMAMFDDQVSSVSTASSDIIFAVKASAIDSASILNVIGTKTSISVTDISTKESVYHNSNQLSGDESIDWYSYFFYEEEFQRTSSLYLDIPVVSNSLITIKISGTGTVSAGNFIIGNIKFLGNTQYGVSAGIIDYSRKETDEFGSTTFTRRNFSKRMNASVSLTNANLNRVQRILYDLRATPILWLASTDSQFEEPLIIYGFYRDFSTEISYPTHSICNIQVEGLI